ncbi:hypothetical protein B0J12DRAFT_157781 [Macrophomina phaseolina]|uniref:Uncharacterized protein n=1 Tax=Macrophomina phaseolina TaxID=35725 RepID=A0ABQ8GRI1_9PEZI|nr:hypothetical protein B0J12DRAFT_157781 [Macrophomina phaseolina]
MPLLPWHKDGLLTRKSQWSGHRTLGEDDATPLRFQSSSMRSVEAGRKRAQARRADNFSAMLSICLSRTRHRRWRAWPLGGTVLSPSHFSQDAVSAPSLLLSRLLAAMLSFLDASFRSAIPPHPLPHVLRAALTYLIRQRVVPYANRPRPVVRPETTAAKSCGTMSISLYPRVKVRNQMSSRYIYSTAPDRAPCWTAQLHAFPKHAFPRVQRCLGCPRRRRRGLVRTSRARCPACVPAAASWPRALPQGLAARRWQLGPCSGDAQ